MNKKLLTGYLILIITPLFFGCGGPLTKESIYNAPASNLTLHLGDEKYYIIDTKESVVGWKASSVHGGHTGYVYISKGELKIESGQLVGGTVEVNMNSIEDKNHGSSNNLINHLKDSDFFEVQKFPFSTIVISGVDSINVEDKVIAGNLTIKGRTHPVTFPAKMKMGDGIVKASGKLVIDRTLWNVRYGSVKFFDILKDRAIGDSIEFQVDIVAKKQG